VSTTLHFGVTLVICTVLGVPMIAARWTWRAPRLGILCWQTLGLTWALCAIGTVLAIGLAPYQTGVPQALARLADDLVAGRRSLDATHLAAVTAGLVMVALLLVALGVTAFSVLRTRRRHRQVLSLVAGRSTAAPSAWILDHPAALAYCLPGRPSRVVLSSGALAMLEAGELAAVLAHEQAHARERHDLVLLPFAALRRLLPVGRVADAVALLVEMRADEAACRRTAPRHVAAALRRISAAGTVAPQGTIGMSDAAVAARLSRIATPPRPLPRGTVGLISLIALALVSTPLTFLVLPS
jgi:bla regulator protein blaR1